MSLTPKREKFAQAYVETGGKLRAKRYVLGRTLTAGAAKRKS